MKKLSVMALLLSLFSAAAVDAATVTYILDLSTAGQFQLRLKSSAGDNAGVASYGAVLVPAAGITVTALDHRSARAGAAENSDGSLGGTLGFTTFRSADGAANLGIRGGQDTLNPTPFIIYGYGQTPGSFASVTNGPATPLGSNEGNDWLAEPVVASGTYTGTAVGNALSFNTASVDTLASTFNSNQGLTTTTATLVTEIIPLVPEPATLAMAGLGLVALVAVRRRQA